MEKRTGEVIENKESEPKSEPDRTGNRTGEVVENTWLWKKRTENEPENEPGHVPDNKRQRENVPKLPPELVFEP